MLAQLHIDSLAMKLNRKAVRISLQRLPKGLNDTYNEILDRIWSQDTEDVELAKGVLGWISYAKRPLKTRELQHALAIMPGTTELDDDALTDVEYLISVCAGIVTIDLGSDIIRLVHYTTQEYMERVKESRLPCAEERIVRTCLDYISLAECASSCDIEMLVERRGRSLERPFLMYAVEHWVTHAQNNEQAIQKHILQFLERPDASLFATRISESFLKRFHAKPVKKVTALCVAAIHGLTNTLRSLLETGADIHERDDRGLTALHYAAESNHVPELLFLIQRGAEIDAVDSCCNTPLHLASYEGHASVVRVLLESGAQMEKKCTDDGTALQVAVRSSHEAIVRLLLSKGSNIQAADFGGDTILHDAVVWLNDAMILMLLEMGANFQARNCIGRTVLHYAARFGTLSAVKLLLRKGVDVNAVDRDGLRPLEYAAKSGRYQTVRLLKLVDVVKNELGYKPKIPSD